MNKTDYWVVYQSPNEDYDCIIWHRDIIDTLIDEHTSENSKDWLYSPYGSMNRKSHRVVTVFETYSESKDEATGWFTIIYNDREYKVSVTHYKKENVKCFEGAIPSEKWLHDFVKYVTMELLSTAKREREK